MYLRNGTYNINNGTLLLLYIIKYDIILCNIFIISHMFRHKYNNNLTKIFLKAHSDCDSHILNDNTI